MKYTFPCEFMVCLFMAALTHVSCAEAVDKLPDNALLKMTHSIETRKANVHDVVAHIAEVYNGAFPNGPQVHAEIKLTNTDMSGTFTKPTSVSLNLSNPTLQDVIGALDHQPGLECRLETNRIVLVSENPHDAPRPEQPRVDSPILPSVVDNIQETVRVRPSLRYSSDRDGSLQLLNSSPLRISVSLNQVRDRYYSNTKEEHHITNLKLKDVKPVIDFNGEGSLDGDVINNIRSEQWVSRSLLHGDTGLGGIIDLFHPSFWPRKIPTGSYVLDVQCCFDAILKNGATEPFVISKPLLVEVVEPSDSVDEAKSISAWSEMLHSLLLRKDYDGFDNQISDSFSSLISDANPLILGAEDERRLGLIAYELQANDVAYSYLSSYIERYKGNPPDSSIYDVHDPFYNALDVFKKICEDLGYSNPYLGKTFKFDN